MYVLTATVRENTALKKMMTKRGFRGVLKKAMKLGVLEWHRRFAKRHFEAQGYGMYGMAKIHNAPLKWKKRKGRPMIQSGTLMRRLLKSKSLSDVRGTSKRVSLRMNIGRPPRRWSEADEGKIKSMIFALMRKHKISYRQAQAKFYRSWGYRQSKAMRTAIQKYHQSEANTLGKYISEKVVETMSKPKAMRRRRIRG